MVARAGAARVRSSREVFDVFELLVTSLVAVTPEISTYPSFSL